MTTTSKIAMAASFDGDGTIRLTSREWGPLAVGDARLEVQHCGLCGSDKRLLQAGASQIPGHEIVGRILAVNDGGPTTTDARTLVNRRAAVGIPVFCGRCDSCQAGWTNRCPNISSLVGWQRDGGFAELVDVPIRTLIPLPDDIASPLGVLLLDTVGTAAHALREAGRIQRNGDVAVLGCGPLGLGSVIVAQDLGHRQVAAADPSSTRLAAAAELGADAVVDGNSYDIVVEASGASSARARALDLVRPGGVVLMLGESNQPWTMPASPQWRRTDANYLRTFYFPMRDVPENLDLLRRNRDRLLSLIDIRAPLTDLQQVFADFSAGRTLKPLIDVRPDGGPTLPTPQGT